MRILPIATAAVLLAACSPPAPLGPQPAASTVLGPSLTADQVREEIVGNTGTGTRTGTQSKWSVYVDPSGSLAVAAPETDSGSWRIADDGRFCMKLQRSWNGQELCQSVHKAGSGVVMRSALSREDMTFVPGNQLGRL